MLNIGLSEMLVVAILVIVFVGPDDLPRMMRLLGRNYAKLRRASEELRRAFTLEVDRVEADRRAEEIRRRREELLARRRAQQEARAATGEAPDGPQPRLEPEEAPSPVQASTDAPEAAAGPPEAPQAAPQPSAGASEAQGGPDEAPSAREAPDADDIFLKGDASKKEAGP